MKTASFPGFLVAVLLLVAIISIPAVPDPPSPSRKLAVAWNDPKGGSGHIDLMNPQAPWAFDGTPLETGHNSVMRVSGSRLYLVCPELDVIKSITLEPWTIERTYPLPRDFSPVDIAIVDTNTAYITGATATHLLRLDLASGTTTDTVDFSGFADPDRVPDLGDMVMYQGHLFVQIRRWNESQVGGHVPPAYLAVVDVASESLIDIDPALAGIQAIALAGTPPKRPMQIVPSLRRLLVSASGGFFDAGGIEMIDLDNLRSMGLAIRESSGLTGADLKPFYLVDSDRGFLVYTTDLTTSSHLVAFSLTTGVIDVSLHTEVDFLAPVLEYDSINDSLFFPSSGTVNPGIHVFNATTGQRLTTNAIPTAGPPTDMAMIGISPTPPDPASLEIAMHPGLSIEGSIGATYQVQYALEVPSSDWTPLTNILLRTSPTLWCDPTSLPHQSRRFYRAVPVP